MKNIILFLIVLTSSMVNVYGQEVLFKENIKISSLLNNKIRESLPIVNKEKNEVALMLLDNDNINALIFNEKYELIDSYKTEKPSVWLKELIGHSIDKNNYHLYFTNNNENKILAKTININKKSTDSKEYEFDSKKEYFLQSVSYLNNFYILTINKKTLILKLYVLNGNKILTKKEYDFSSIEFYGNYKKYNFFQYFDIHRKNFTYGPNLSIKKIDNNNPNPIDITRYADKLYATNNKIYLTIDDDEKTKIISIDLKTYKGKVQNYNQAHLNGKKDKWAKKARSYIYDEKLYQIRIKPKEFAVQIKNLENDSILKTFKVKTEDEITFKNTPLMQQGSKWMNTNEKRELSKTKQFIRKLNSSTPAVSAYSYNNLIELTIGGYSIKQATSSMGGMQTTTSTQHVSTSTGYISVPITVSTYNPTLYSYGSYTGSRSIYFKSLLSKDNFEHVKGDVEKNAYDKIKDYEETVKGTIKSKTIFKVKDKYLFGYFNKSSKKYLLLKF